MRNAVTYSKPERFPPSAKPLRGLATLYCLRSSRVEVGESWREVATFFRNITEYRAMYASHSARMALYSKARIKAELR